MTQKIPAEFSIFHEDSYFKGYINVHTLKLTESATIPTRNLHTDAGMDIYASEDIFIPVGSTAKVHTGIAIKVPDGYVGKIEGRSSMNTKGLITAGGVIDAGYNGEIGIVLHNFSSRLETQKIVLASGEQSKVSQKGYQVSAGDKIAQMLLYKIETPTPVQVNELWESNRGSNGFGSSGR